MATTEPRLGVVYLARAADGILALEKFTASYARHDAGVEHELIVIYKGFTDVGGLEGARHAFAGIAHRGIELDDTGFDIGSYLAASERLAHDNLCFLNTHTEILSGGWLGVLAAHGGRDAVGIVGAMGSYESLRSSVRMMEAAIAACCRPRARPTPELVGFYDFLLPRFRPDWYGAAPASDDATRSWRTYLAAWITARREKVPRGTELIWPGAPELDTRVFPRFPNPHIRSNGFLVKRTRLLSLDLAKVHTKADANLFESGLESLTAQIRRAGLEAVVVGRDGTGYAVADWAQSRTFRAGDQGNLLLGDNHTRAFIGMSEGGRLAHERMTWGDYLAPAPDAFPNFGVRFPIRPSVTGASGIVAPPNPQVPSVPPAGTGLPPDVSPATFLTPAEVDSSVPVESHSISDAGSANKPIMSTDQLPVRPWLVVFRAGQVFTLAIEDIDRFPFEDSDEISIEPSYLTNRWFRTPDHDPHVPVGPGIGVRVPPVLNIVEFMGYRIPKHLVRLTGAGIETFDRLGKAHLVNYGQTKLLSPDMTFLEIGSGAGRDAFQLTQVLGPEGRYYGIDVQRESIVWCQNNITLRHPNFTFHHFNAEHELHNPLALKTTLDFPLPALDKSVDFVALGSVFTHIFEDEVRYYLREIARVLKDDGICYATFFLYRDEVVEASRRNNVTHYGLTFEHAHGGGCYISNPHYPTGSVAFTEAKMMSMIEDAGLVLDRPFIMGEWSGFYPVQEIRDGQDVAVLRRVSDRPDDADRARTAALAPPVALAGPDAAPASSSPVARLAILPDSRFVPPPLSSDDQDLVERFTKFAYELADDSGMRTYTSTWMGHGMLKWPTDLWAYQELVVRIRPDVIIETGTFRGGSALFLASLCDLLDHGEVVSIDLDTDMKPHRPRHSRITYLDGSSTDPNVVKRVEDIARSRCALVILDSDHRFQHVLDELRIYQRFVPQGSFLVVEDTLVNGHPVSPDFGPGPWEAVEAFLGENGSFTIDRSLEKVFLTQNPRGYLFRHA